MACKPKWPPLPVGDRCHRCHEIIVGPAIQSGIRDLCVSCFLRPRVIVQIVERLQRQESVRCSQP